jgi:hypothetical protein
LEIGPWSNSAEVDDTGTRKSKKKPKHTSR